MDTLLRLKSLAWLNVRCQFCGLLFYTFSLLFAENNNATTVICGAVAICIALVPLMYAVLTRQFLLLLSCLALFNMAPIWFLYLEAIIPGYDAFEYSSAIMRIEVFAWAGLFELLANLLYILFWSPTLKRSVKWFSFLNRQSFGPGFYFNLTVFAFAFTLLAFLVYYGSFEMLWMALTAGRSGGGSGAGLLLQENPVHKSESYMLPLNWLWQLTPTFGIIGYYSNKETSTFKSGTCLLFALLTIFSSFLGGSRGMMMFAVAPVLFFVVYFNWHKGLRFWLLFSVVIVFLVGIMELQVRFRGNLLTVIADPAKAAKAENLSSVTTFDPTKSHRDNNTYLFCLIVKLYPSKYKFQGFDEFFAILMNPIPRTIWPGKPLMQGARDMAFQSPFVLDGPLALGTTSLTYSVVGEAYLAKGFWGILVYAVVYGFFMLFFDGIIAYTSQRNVLSIAFLAIGVFLAFWGFRSFFALVTFAYPLILLMLLVKLFRRFGR